MAGENEIGIKVVVTSDQAEAGAQDAAAAINKAAAQMVTAMTRLTSSMNRTASSARASMGQTAQAFTAATAQVNAFSASVQSAGAQANSGFSNISSGATSASTAVKGLGRASTGARRELIVMVHELSTGNFTRFEGSILVLMERFRALGAIMSPVGLSIAAVVVAMGALAIGALKGANQIHELDEQLALTGNRAGLTQQRFLDLAKAIANTNSTNRGSAQNAVQQTAATGVFGPQATRAVAQVSDLISSMSGETSQKVVDDFAKMDEGVYKFANTNKEAKDLLTAADLQYVKSLEDAGEKEQAEVYVADQLSSKLAGMRSELGLLPSILQSVGNAWHNFWDNVMDAGRPETPEQKMAALGDQIAAMRGRMAQGGSGTMATKQSDIDPLLQQQAIAQENVRLSNEQAAADARSADANVRSKNALVLINETKDKLLKGEDLVNKKFSALTQANADTQLTGGTPLSDSQMAAAHADLEKRYNAPKRGGGVAGPSSVNAPAQAAAAAELALTKDAAAQSEKALTDSYRANEISLQKYFATRMSTTKAAYAEEIATTKTELGQATAAQALARTPDARSSASAKVLTVQGKLTLLTQQQAEAATNLTAEYEEQLNTQSKQLSIIGIQSQASAATANVTRQQTLSKAAESSGQINSKTAIKQEQDLQDQLYLIQLNALDQRRALLGQSVEAYAEIDAQILTLEQQHQQQMLQLQVQADAAKNVSNKAITGDIQNSFAGLITNLTSGTHTLKQSFDTFLTSLETSFSNTFAKMATDALTGSGTQGGGILQSLLSFVGLGASTASGGAGAVGALSGVGYGSMSTGVDAANVFGFMPAYAKGTNYVPETQMALLHKGEAVVPASMNGTPTPGQGSNVVQNFHLTQQADLRTQTQIGAKAAAGLQRAQRRNN